MAGGDDDDGNENAEDDDDADDGDEEEDDDDIWNKKCKGSGHFVLDFSDRGKYSKTILSRITMKSLLMSFIYTVHVQLNLYTFAPLISVHMQLTSIIGISIWMRRLLCHSVSTAAQISCVFYNLAN